MDSAADEWMKADRPNYVVNVDKNYPYSELPFLGKYYLIKIPTSGQLVEHVDYWGEGRITVSEGKSGFPDCYNVNRQYQLVSNGTDRDRKIPNRIPVYSEDICDTTSYIIDNTVKLVTLMGAPIIESCAQDIARIVNSEVGKVVVYGFDQESEAIILLTAALRDSSIFFCPQYELSEYLSSVTLFDSHMAFLNEKDISEELYNAVTGGSFDKAVEITKSLIESEGGSVVEAVIDRLLQQGIRLTTSFAYKIWISGAQNTVEKYFPPAFKLLFNDDDVKIESNYYKMILKLDANVDEYNDRLAWGSKTTESNNAFIWKLIPIWENNFVMFKIMNTKYTMFLKLDANVDSNGDRKCWGSETSNEVTHTWKLEPMKLNEDVVFFIVNREYDQALKLDSHTDVYGDRLLWGNNGIASDKPEYFGWFIKPW